jgi:ribosomal protein S27E
LGLLHHPHWSFGFDSQRRGPKDGGRRTVTRTFRIHTTSHAHTARSRVRSILTPSCSNFTLTLLHTGRSLDHRNPTGAQRAASARSGFLIVCCSDCTPASFPYASASSTHTHTLSLDSCCRPTAGKSSSPAGLSTLVYAYVVDCAPASPYAYSSSTHRFPDERTPIEATPLSATSAELGLVLGLGLGLDSLSHFSSHALPFFSPPSFHTISLSPAFTSVWWSD